MRVEKSRFYALNPDWTAIWTRKTLVFVYEERQVGLTLEGFDDLATSFIDCLLIPISGSALVAKLKKDHGAKAVEHCHEWLEELLRHGVVLQGTYDAVATKYPQIQMLEPTKKKPISRLIFCITGSAHAAFIADLLLPLERRVCQEVDIIVTRAAQRFVNLEVFKRRGVRVWTGLFQTQDNILSPIQLAKAAQIIVIMPATARTLFRLAHGSCSDLTSFVATTSRAPVLVFPAMNRRAWEHPAVARNVRQLQRDGYYVIQPDRSPSLLDTGNELNAMGSDFSSRFDRFLTILLQTLEIHSHRGSSR